jgi:hypothetical protein
LLNAKFQLRSQLTERLAAEDSERKRRINVEEEKSILSVRLEAALSAQSLAAGSTDGSDLDTYRVMIGGSSIL